MCKSIHSAIGFEKAHADSQKGEALQVHQMPICFGTISKLEFAHAKDSSQ
jgi:hypothetical protein